MWPAGGHNNNFNTTRATRWLLPFFGVEFFSPRAQHGGTHGRLQVKKNEGASVQRMTSCAVTECYDDECQKEKEEEEEESNQNEPPIKKTKVEGCQERRRFSMEEITNGNCYYYSTTKNESSIIDPASNKAPVRDPGMTNVYTSNSFAAGVAKRENTTMAMETLEFQGGGSRITMNLEPYRNFGPHLLDGATKEEVEESIITKVSDKRESMDEELAKTLFLMEEHGVDIDDRSKKALDAVPGTNIEHDRMLALKLHMEEVDEERKRLRIGQATRFVQNIMDSFRPGGPIYDILSQMPLLQQHMGVIAADDMVFMAERMLHLQAQFREKGVDSHVDIGYHYTKPENLEHIRSDGLLTHSDRAAVGMNTSLSGSFGQGIYTANNPSAFTAFGSIGIIVARLKGTCVQWDDLGGNESLVSAGMHTVLGNKLNSCPHTEEVVLRNSAQCLPLICYNRIAIWTRDIDIPSVLSEIELILQNLIGQFFTPTETLIYTAPKRLLQDDQCYFRVHELISNPECAMCREKFSLTDPPMAVLTCVHTFHENCIQAALIRRSYQCPVCCRRVREPQGKSPSGTMTVGWSIKPCSGFGPGTFVIDYHIHPGIQLAYHENPGHSFDGVTRRAYVPDCVDGRRLLKRLKYAFLRGLTFTVETTLSAGKASTVVWASIGHKTSRNGRTVQGFPDPGYFVHCNEELDNLGVPRVECLL